MKVLFLDIDGVLNSSRTAEAFGRYSWTLDPDEMRLFDAVALGMIRRLCAETGAVVVWSSTWRLSYSINDLGTAFDLPTVGETPVLVPGTRGDEIAAWLADHPEVTTYAIVDDDDDMLPEQQLRFVKTNPINGLTYEDYLNLLSILSK